mgnify:CR=1 FL=1
MRTLRNGLIIAAMASACLITAAPDAPAASRRPQNPYSSFNISGINYGSQQWQKSQSKSRSSSPRRSFFGGFRFR